MATYSRLFSAVEAAEKIMSEWSDDEDNAVDIVLLPPEHVDSITDDEEVDEDSDKFKGMPTDVCGSAQIQTNLPDESIASIGNATASSEPEPIVN